MMEFMLQAHSGWRYLVILITIAAIAKYGFSWLTARSWTGMDQMLGTAMPIVYDIQLLLGLLLWIMQQRWTGVVPLSSWEHPVTMILAVVAAHITWSRVKKTSDDAVRFRTGAVGFLAAGVIMALGMLRITRIV